jgi:hypothetical protein
LFGGKILHDSESVLSKTYTKYKWKQSLVKSFCKNSQSLKKKNGRKYFAERVLRTWMEDFVDEDNWECRYDSKK